MALLLWTFAFSRLERKTSVLCEDARSYWYEAIQPLLYGCGLVQYPLPVYLRVWEDYRPLLLDEPMEELCRKAKPADVAELERQRDRMLVWAWRCGLGGAYQPAVGMSVCKEAERLFGLEKLGHMGELEFRLQDGDFVFRGKPLWEMPSSVLEKQANIARWRGQAYAWMLNERTWRDTGVEIEAYGSSSER